MTPPRIRRGTTTASKWPFFETLKVGFYYEEPDLSKHAALRTAASRQGQVLKKRFRVRKEMTEAARGRPSVEVIRVYRPE